MIKKLHILVVFILVIGLISINQVAVASTHSSTRPDENTIQNASGSNSFVLCSEAQRTTLNNARSIAINYVKGAKAYLDANKQDSRYTRWFGVFDRTRYKTVSTNFNSILSVLKTASITFDCGKSNDSFCPTIKGVKTIACVQDWHPYIIRICTPFWDPGFPPSGTLSQAGILIHEISHFNVVADTGDLVDYGPFEAKRLAIRDPSQAIKNANNYEYFAVEVPTSPPTITRTPILIVPRIHLREQLYWNTVYKGSVDSLNLEKWPFFFNSQRAFTLRLARTSGNAVFRLKVFKNNGQVVASSQGSSNASIHGQYLAGNYYAIVEAVSGSGSYNISIVQEALKPTVHLRAQLYWNEIHNGSVNTLNFEKWPFYFNSQRAFTLNLVRISGNAVFRMKVFNNQGQALGSIQGNNILAFSRQYPTGHYYAIIESVSGSGAYRISITQQLPTGTVTPTLTTIPTKTSTFTNTPQLITHTPTITITTTPVGIVETITSTPTPANTLTPTFTLTAIPPTVTWTVTSIPTSSPTIPPIPTVHLREQIFWDEVHNGSVDTLNFEKWPFLFTDWRAYTLNLTRTGGDAVFRMTVFDSNNQPMVSADGGGANVFVTGLYQPANYYAIVEVLSGSGTYNLSISQPPVTVRGQLLWNQTYSGSVSASSFEKWTFLFTATRHFQINLTHTSGDGIFRLVVLNSAGVPISDSEGSNTSVSGTYPAGDYSVLVQPVSGSGYYTISITQLP